MGLCDATSAAMVRRSAYRTPFHRRYVVSAQSAVSAEKLPTPAVAGEGQSGGQEKLTASSADEHGRAGRSAIAPSRRWHYRYVAAELTWSAAELLPNETDETARVLGEAGSWLKARDLKNAERFYKALVRRRGTTDLGREAGRLHWFPALSRGNARE